MVSLWMISVSLHGGHLRVRSPDIIFRMWAPALSPRLYWVQSGGALVELDALLRTGRSPLCALRMRVELRWLSLCGACALVCVFWFVCCLLYAQLADLGSVWTPASLGFAVSMLGCVDDIQASYLFRFDAGPGPDWSSASQ